MNEEKAIENLKLLDNIFRKHNVRYWLQDGTLLGYYRDNKLLSHDNDTDIGIKWADFDKNALIEILKNGFRIKSVLGRIEDSLVLNLRRQKISTDIYFYYYKPTGTFYHTTGCGANWGTRIDFDYKNFEVKDVDFYNHKFSVPENEEYFLKTKYGNNWKVPDLGWDSSYHPLNKVLTNIVTPREQSKDEFYKWFNK
jgi:phosphorylcholine metabolism protein LicD